MRVKNLFLGLFFILILLGMTSTVLQGQSAHLKSSTLASMGKGEISNQNFIIRQSIGQSSVIGTFQNDGVYFGQGFLSGVLPTRKSKEAPIKIIAYPNSFVDEVRFRFVPGYNFDVAMSIFDMSGKIVYKNKITPINSEVEINLEKLSSGLYIVFFNFGNRLLQSRIIKL